MNDEQRAKLKFATLKLMDTSYRSGWLSEQVIGLDNPEEYKLKIKYLGRSISARKEAEEEIWELVEDLVTFEEEITEEMIEASAEERIEDTEEKGGRTPFAPTWDGESAMPARGGQAATDFGVMVLLGGNGDAE